MAPTILIKFCGLIVHPKPNNVVLANFPEKIPETKKKINFFPSPKAGPNQLIKLVQTLYLAFSCKYLDPFS